MNNVPVIAIFDIGKTNKKVFLFDEKYTKLYEETIQLKEITDEDGDNCEDLMALTEWVRNSFKNLHKLKDFEIKAVNFSAYGASFVHIMEKGASLLPLYNYLKPYPQQLQNEFYSQYGGEELLSKETSSPVSGSLNAGLQLYRIKKLLPQVFDTIVKSLHLPQYLSFLITNQMFSDITSVGCHTLLWDFEKSNYHKWVIEDGIDKKLAPLSKSDETVEATFENKAITAGIGLHDSSAALIPYLISFEEPFILISTGTWCISLNPFNHTPLTNDELNNDCLCYLQYKGLPVKASRLFVGYEHKQQTQVLSQHFKKPADYYKNLVFDQHIIHRLKAKSFTVTEFKTFSEIDVNLFSNYEEAYHQLMISIVAQQVMSTTLVLNTSSNVKKIFVDGGFAKNDIYMNLMANAFTEIEVYAASMAQASALGAALAIHHKWNSASIPSDLISLRKY
jgi:L-fuculokinase